MDQYKKIKSVDTVSHVSRYNREADLNHSFKWVNILQKLFEFSIFLIKFKPLFELRKNRNMMNIIQKFIVKYYILTLRNSQLVKKHGLRRLITIYFINSF